MRSAHVLFTRLSSKARLRHLQLLAHIGDLGSLQKAAEAVFMSQSAATKALAELEQLLDTTLFERHARGMRPTAVCTALLPLVRRAIKSLRECMELVAAMDAGITSTLRVGAVGGGISGVLCRAVPSFSMRHPGVVVNVTQSGPEELLTACSHRALDVAICRAPERLPEGFQFTPLAADRYVVACSPRHRLAVCVASHADLAGETWLMPEQTGISGRGFERLWEELGHQAKICWVTSRSPLLMEAMLETRQLLRYVPYSTVRHQVEAGTLATISGPWEKELPPLGALARTLHTQSDDALPAFLAELVACSDLQAGEPDSHSNPACVAPENDSTR